jgi:hypothetical protein
MQHKRFELIANIPHICSNVKQCHHNLHGYNLVRDNLILDCLCCTHCNHVRDPEDSTATLQLGLT